MCISAADSLFNPFNSRKFINVYLLLTIPIQNKLFRCENIGIDHILQAIQYKKNLPNCLKGKYRYLLGEFSNTFVVRVKNVGSMSKNVAALDSCPCSVISKASKQYVASLLGNAS